MHRIKNMFRKLFVVFYTFAIIILVTVPMLSAKTVNAQTEIASTVTGAGTMLQQSNSGITKYDNNTGRTIILRGVISSESGISSEPGHFLQQLNVQRAIILPHRQDGKDYTGILTFSASKPVEIVLGHRIEIDKNTTIDTKRFGSLFIINPIHPHAGYVLSAPSVIKPEYGGFLAPYYSASIPFAASSVILRTLGAVPFIAAYEVNAQLGQPRIINNLTTAENLPTNNTK
jgi:hypothetical protein